MAATVKLRNKSGQDLEVSFLRLRVIKAGEVAEVAGTLVDDPAVVHELLDQPEDTEPAPLADDAWYIAHPTGDQESPVLLYAWPKATWDLVTDKPAAKPAAEKKES
jgi:hypothetical protein